MGRERWTVRNPTQKNINIGDLFRVPTLAPNEQRNLLDYHNHSELTQSGDLASLLSMGWLILVKTNVPSHVQLNRIEQDELDKSIAEAVKKTVILTNSWIINDASTDVILADASLNALTVTLPVGVSGRKIYVKKTDSTSNAVTVIGHNSQTIDDSLTWEISVQYVTMEIVSDGTNWHII